MKHVIAILENSLQVMENNEPINRAEGNIAQADLERDTAAELRQALAILRDETKTQRTSPEALPELQSASTELIQIVEGVRHRQ